MKNQITPGEWTIDYKDDPDLHPILRNEVGESIAIIVSSQNKHNESTSKKILSAVNNTYGKGIDPDRIGELVSALETIIGYNLQQAADQYGDRKKAEGWACVVTARKALESIKLEESK